MLLNPTILLSLMHYKVSQCRHLVFKMIIYSDIYNIQFSCICCKVKIHFRLSTNLKWSNENKALTSTWSKALKKTNLIQSMNYVSNFDTIKNKNKHVASYYSNSNRNSGRYTKSEYKQQSKIIFTNLAPKFHWYNPVSK